MEESNVLNYRLTFDIAYRLVLPNVYRYQIFQAFSFSPKNTDHRAELSDLERKIDLFRIRLGARRTLCQLRTHFGRVILQGHAIRIQLDHDIGLKELGQASKHLSIRERREIAARRMIWRESMEG